MRHGAALLVLTAFLSFIACHDAWAQADGAVIVRVPDGVGSRVRCIDPGVDKIWLTLRRVVVNRTENWLSRDRSIAIILNAVVSTDPQLPKPISFPLASEASLQDYAAGQVSVPIEYTVASGLPLKQGSHLVTGIAVEMTILNRKERGTLGVALEALLQTANKLPIPSNPTTQAATYLLDYANSAVGKSIESHNAREKLRSAAIALNFAPDGKCNSRNGATPEFESAGTKLVLQAAGERGPGYVPLNMTNEYCWTAEMHPAFVVKAARRQPKLDCDDPSYRAQYRQVTNNYAGFFLNARAATGTLAGNETDERESLQRCRLHGIGADACFQ